MRNYAWLNRGHEVFVVNLDYPIHSLGGKDHATAHGKRPTREAGPTAPGSDRDIIFVAKLKNFGNLWRGDRFYYDFRKEDKILGLVMGVRLDIVPLHEHMLVTCDSPEALDNFRRYFVKSRLFQFYPRTDIISIRAQGKYIKPPMVVKANSLDLGGLLKQIFGL
jgi:hypothetical protein